MQALARKAIITISQAKCPDLSYLKSVASVACKLSDKTRVP